jgi:hypothetical protein
VGALRAGLGGLDVVFVADAPYLVALAFIEQQERRLLPLAGKSQSADAASAVDPGEDGRALALELLLRIWQRSDEGPVKRAAEGDSLLLVELPMEVMSEQLPLLKASWISGADTEELLSRLQALVIRGWRISIAKYQPVSFSRWC